MSADLPPIDWSVAEATGRRLVRPGPVLDPGPREQLVAGLRSAARTAVRLGEDATELPATGNPIDLVVDRPGWIRANTQLAAALIEAVGPSSARRPAAQRVAGAALGAQVGAVFAALAGRVLGQFDPFTAPGRLYLVAPNIADVELALALDPDDFRLWVCLHEQTHRLQFTAAPWLPGHLTGMIGELLDDEEERGLADVLRDLGDRGRRGDRPPFHGSIDEWFRSPAQRSLFDRANAVMALLEGHADVMMDRAGEASIPSLSVIRQRFESRRTHTMLASRLGRLLGLDRKLAQYREGASFCRRVIDRVGVTGLNAVWSGPELLPDPAEIARPDAWVARVHG